MIDIGKWGAIAGSITAIVSLVLLVIKPVISSFAKITETLSEVNYTLRLLTKDLEASKDDRSMIHEELKRHDDRLDDQDKQLVKHKQQIITLFKETRK
ncbi:hypothetical protein [Enterococcus thailandicus]|uniref:hypothetical protein n=1 Tax=Enterococcus thailandicus TaxID=417368 RepID=UPI0035D92155